MPTATNTNTTSTRFSGASIVAGMITPALATTNYTPVSDVWPRRRDLLGALEASRDIALRLGSAWDVVLPGITRKTLLDHAHELIDLTWRAEDRRGRYRGKPRRIMLRHPRTWT
jgi:hypothetical protein